MLFKFLIEHKEEIIQLCKDKTLAASKSKPTSVLLDQGLPVFYNELINMLKKTAAAPPGSQLCDLEKKLAGDAAIHGKESLRLGYTISQVVHTYGAVCQSITEYAKLKNFTITSQEFQDLNLALDFAIAESVSEFEKTQSENAGRSQIERLSSLIHEMGSSLAAASIAFGMLQSGRVGVAGTTSNVLSSSLAHIRQLFDSSLTEVRLRGNTIVETDEIRLIDLISELEATALMMAKSKNVQFEHQVDSSIQFTADRQLIFSALSNLVMNAMKFTKEHSKVTVRCKESGGRVMIEVEDECGGLPDGKTEELFKPFPQLSAGKLGVGLGLSLSRKAIELNQGKLTARNILKKGCVFTIDLPKTKKASS